MNKETKKALIWLIMSIVMLIVSIINYINLCKLIDKTEFQRDYIQNLEEKLNIYERSYEEFCLEDSLRQVE